jgi:3-oxoacyl-[acyl-carrier protein] reductase
MNRLQGKTALVTGSSRGLGAAIARGFAREGARVVVNYRENASSAAEVVRAINEDGGEAIAVRADCTIERDVIALVEQTIAAYGEIRILVNNAGIGTRGKIAEMPVAQWDEMMTSHLRSAFLVTHYCLRTGMADLPLRSGERIAAKIINMGSGLVNRGGLGAREMVHYMTAKAGIAGFTRGLAAELAPRMTVNALAPGIHFTDMVAGGAPSQELREALAGLFLLGLPVDEDVAAAAIHLASPAADHVTAEIFTMNGGSS